MFFWQLKKGVARPDAAGSGLVRLSVARQAEQGMATFNGSDARDWTIYLFTTEGEEMASKKKSAAAPASNPPGTLVSLSVPMPDPNMLPAAQQFLTMMEGVTITDDMSYEEANSLLLKLNSKEDEIEKQRKTLKDPINQAANAVQSLFNPPLHLLQRARTIIKGKISAYATAQENKRRAEATKAEELRRKEQEKLLAQAKAAENRGNVIKAQELEHRAITTVAAPVTSLAPPKVSGVRLVETWLYEISDPSKIPREYLCPDLSKIAGVVKAMKGDSKIDGVRVWSEMRPAAGKG